jgi:hypothetical protein
MTQEKHELAANGKLKRKEYKRGTRAIARRVGQTLDSRSRGASRQASGRDRRCWSNRAAKSGVLRLQFLQPPDLIALQAAELLPPVTSLTQIERIGSAAP